MITTHVLDTARGRPAAGVRVTLERAELGAWSIVGAGATDADGRLRTLVPDGAPGAAGTYRIRFDTGAYFEATGQSGFYPYVEVIFEVRDAGAHHHVPLLLSPFGYSTYRGS
jgi:5-hydroxyisourate hydrolase